MSKNAKQQLNLIKQHHIDAAEKELHEWVDQPWFGPRRKKAVEHLIRQLRFPTYWCGKHTFCAWVFFPEPRQDRVNPDFTIRNCKATTNGIIATFRSRRWVLEVKNNRLYFPKECE